MAYTAKKIKSAELVAGTTSWVYNIVTEDGIKIHLLQNDFEALFTEGTTKAAPKPKPTPAAPADDGE
jgi:hypothetical protein